MSILGDAATVAAGGPVGTAWVFIKRFGPYIIGALVIAGLLFALHRYGNNREEEGAASERVKWEAQAAKAAAIAVTLAQERQAAVDAAETANAERDRVYALKTAPIKVEVQSYAKSPAAIVRCVDAVGVSIGSKAIAAANAATQAAR